MSMPNMMETTITLNNTTIKLSIANLVIDELARKEEILLGLATPMLSTVDINFEN